MVNEVELKLIIGLPNPRNQFLKPVKCPTIKFVEIQIGNLVSIRIEVGEVPKEEAKRVTDTEVGIGLPFQDLIRDLDVVFIILCRDPQPQHIGSKLIDHLFRKDHIPR